MPSDLPTPDEGADSPHTRTNAPKMQRVLACVLCQQRKIRCDRKSPCANCIKSGAHCVSASLAPRQRRRRFPERELLDRVRHYEDLLSKHDIEFEPLHGAPAVTPTSSEQVSTKPPRHGSAENHTEGPNEPWREREANDQDYRTKYVFSGISRAGSFNFFRNFWHAMNRKVGIQVQGSRAR